MPLLVFSADGDQKRKLLSSGPGPLLFALSRRSLAVAGFLALDSVAPRILFFKWCPFPAMSPEDHEPRLFHPVITGCALIVSGAATLSGSQLLVPEWTDTFSISGRSLTRLWSHRKAGESRRQPVAVIRYLIL